MKLLNFRSSKEASLGVELEFQIINPRTFGLISRAKDLIRNIKESAYQLCQQGNERWVGLRHFYHRIRQESNAV